jgi:hypothetical protein
VRVDDRLRIDWLAVLADRLTSVHHPLATITRPREFNWPRRAFGLTAEGSRSKRPRKRFDTDWSPVLFLSHVSAIKITLRGI